MDEVKDVQVVEGSVVSKNSPIGFVDPKKPFKPKINLKPIFTKIREYKVEIWKDLTKKEREWIGSGVFLSFFDYWSQHRYRDKLCEFKWEINRDFFESDETWNNYIKRNFNNQKIFQNPSDDATEFEFNQNYIEHFSQKFEEFYDSHYDTISPADENISEDNGFDVGDELNGFHTVEKFKEKFPNAKFKSQYKMLDGKKVLIPENELYVPKRFITSHNICSLVFKFSPNIPNFINNPLLKSSEYMINETDLVRRIKVRIIDKTPIVKEELLKTVGCYVYYCSSCFKELIYKPYEMSVVDVKHLVCPKNIGSDGNFLDVKIDKKSYIEGKSLMMHCYQCHLFDEEKKIELKDNFYVFSFDSRIKPGIYFIDVVNVNGKLSSPKDKIRRPIILGIEKASEKIIPNIINREDGIKLAEEFGCIPHKYFDIWSGAINFLRTDRNIELDPHKGSLLQLFLITTLTSKFMFGYRNFATSIIGETSISKSYSAKLLGKLMDLDFVYTSGRESATYSGIFGGINTEAIVMGRVIRIFESGAVGKGLVLFDEAPQFWEDPKINEYLKNILNDEVTIIKTGAGDTYQRFTPYIFCNEMNHHRGMLNKNKYQDNSYVGRVKFFYWNSIKGFEDLDLPHEKTKIASDLYINNLHLFRPLQYYSNIPLRESIAMTRNEFTRQNKCWWTGGDIASQNRLLFDAVVIADRDKEKESNPFNNEPKREYRSDNVPDLPTEDFVNTAREYLYGDDDRRISLKFGTKLKREVKEQIDEGEIIEDNPDEILDQLHSLKKSIYDFLKTGGEGECIVIHYSDGKYLDDKLANMIFMFLLNSQLANNTRSTELDEATKSLAKKMLLKCKTGITEDEYNFKDHSYVPDINIIKENLGSKLATKSEEIRNITESKITDLAKKIDNLEKEKGLEFSKDKPKQSNDVEPIDFKIDGENQ